MGWCVEILIGADSDYKFAAVPTDLVAQAEETAKKQRIAESTPGKRGVWSETGYLGLPGSASEAVYTLYWVALFPLTAWAAVYNRGPGRLTHVGGVDVATAVAAAVAYAPIGLALLLARLSADRMSWRWPFHKERLVGTLGLFLLLGWAVCVLPVYHATRMICA